MPSEGKVNLQSDAVYTCKWRDHMERWLRTESRIRFGLALLPATCGILTS